jgi:protein-S-isoprenylcysteine O-methyltransferase Ste14
MIEDCGEWSGENDAVLSRALRNLPLPEPFLIGIGAGALLQRLRPWALPGSQRKYRLVGSCLIASGSYLVIRSVDAAGSVVVDHPRRLLTTGPYAVIRNPMYVGWALLHLGSGLAANSGWILAALPPAALRVHREVLAEEGLLGERFGEEFRRYRATVGRYLPG